MAYKDEVDYSKSKICETCGTIYYKKKYLSTKAWEKQKFCSLFCRRPKKYYRKKYSTKKSEITYIVQCRNCKKFFFVESLYYFKKRKFCSQSCSAEYRVKIGEVKRYWTKERRDRKREKQKKLVKLGLWKNPIYMPGVIEKIKATKAANPRKFSDEELSEYSKRAADRIINGNNPNLGYFKYGKIGHYYSNKLNKKILYRSLFEKRAFEILDAREDIAFYITEPFHIKYTIDGIERYYIPDVLVEYIDGKKQLIEIKPLVKLKEKETVLKAEAAEQYCIDNKIEKGYIFWTELVLFPNRNLNRNLNGDLNNVN